MSPLPITKSNFVYPRFLGKEVTVRDRTGMDYRGTLKVWRNEFITLLSDGEEIVISREADNIVSMRVKMDGGTRKDRKEEL
jgi:hypothetical protein